MRRVGVVSEREIDYVPNYLASWNVSVMIARQSCATTSNAQVKIDMFSNVCTLNISFEFIEL